jgi:hypothetical protein
MKTYHTPPMFNVLARLAIVLIAYPSGLAQPAQSILERLEERKLNQLVGPVTTHYSVGARVRALKLQADIREMNALFNQKLGVQSDVTLAVLNRGDWIAVAGEPAGLPLITGQPSVVFLPAESGGFAFELIMSRKEAIPTTALNSYLKRTGKTYEMVADDFVDIIGFHELGHALSEAYGISYRHCRWLNEFVASYFAYAFVSEKRPEAKQVFELCGRPSKARPKNTTLEDFERLYVRVDDYGWYQGMFEIRVQELYSDMGLKFLADLKAKFPSKSESKESPEVVVDKMESIAPGFRAWARGFERTSVE